MLWRLSARELKRQCDKSRHRCRPSCKFDRTVSEMRPCCFGSADTRGTRQRSRCPGLSCCKTFSMAELPKQLSVMEKLSQLQISQPGLNITRGSNGEMNRDGTRRENQIQMSMSHHQACSTELRASMNSLHGRNNVPVITFPFSQISSNYNTFQNKQNW